MVTIPITITPTEQGELLEVKQKYAKHLGLNKLSWTAYVLLISKELKLRMENLEHERRRT